MAVALLERLPAETGEPGIGGLLSVREIGIAVAELLRQIELEPLGKLDRHPYRVGVVREPRRHLLGREQHELLVAAPLCLAAVERGVARDRDENVLQAHAAAVVRMDVPGRDGAHAERLRQISKRRVAAGVAAEVRPLQLDEEALTTEHASHPRDGVRIDDGEPTTGAPRETDEAVP